jgi:hypothetical protein
MPYTHNIMNPVFQPGGQSVVEGGLGWRVSNVLVFWMAFDCKMNMDIILPGVIAVACGLGESDDWPYFFGR